MSEYGMKNLNYVKENKTEPFITNTSKWSHEYADQNGLTITCETSNEFACNAPVEENEKGIEAINYFTTSKHVNVAHYKLRLLVNGKWVNVKM
jgi:hypothetical protein